MKFYKCLHCGNVVELIVNGGGELVCCHEPMQELKPKTSDQGNEKHVPVATLNGDLLEVKIGEISHPMEAKHHISWILIKNGNKIQRVDLDQTMEPKASFIINPEESIEIYEYCNLHGLWQTKID